MSGVAYRRWGEAELSHDARIAALLLLVLLLYLLVARDAPHCIATMLLRSAGIAIGATLVLYFGVSDCYLPLVALAAVSGGIGLPLALLAAAVVAPSLYLLPTVALAAPVLAGLVAERISPR